MSLLIVRLFEKGIFLPTHLRRGFLKLGEPAGHTHSLTDPPRRIRPNRLEPVGQRIPSSRRVPDCARDEPASCSTRWVHRLTCPAWWRDRTLSIKTTIARRIGSDSEGQAATANDSFTSQRSRSAVLKTETSRAGLHGSRPPLVRPQGRNSLLSAFWGTTIISRTFILKARRTIAYVGSINCRYSIAYKTAAASIVGPGHACPRHSFDAVQLV
jgi:hypothetical protein